MNPTEPLYRPRLNRREISGAYFKFIGFLAMMVCLATMIVLVVAVVVTAFGHREELGRPPLSISNPIALGADLGGYLWQLATRITSSSPERDGYRVGIVGSLWLLVLVAAFTIPTGVGASVFLEEYLPPGRLRGLIQTNIANLAGVPSVVYGILGLAVFVNGMGFPRLEMGKTLWAGSLTLSILVLPVVVIATQEALRSVPSSLRQAALALGATRWQVVRDHVIPSALPGIMTGIILALSRAIGETAPLVVVGAATSLMVVPHGPSDLYSALPVEIYSDAREPAEAFQTVAAGGILLLLLSLLTMNAAAILIRNHYRARSRG